MNATKPIIFSAPMIRAILAGRKTQTRRLIRWPAWTLENGQPTEAVLHNLAQTGGVAYSKNGTPRRRFSLPWRAGDWLWVRETCFIAPPGFGDWHLCNAVDGTGRRRSVGYFANMSADSEDCARDYGVRKSPAIYMPRWASRIALEVTAVRMEQLQRISVDDARAEGAMGAVPILDFARLWNAINYKRCPWDCNPWVVVITFARRVSQEDSQC